MPCRSRTVSRTTAAERTATRGPGAESVPAARASWRTPQQREERMIHRRSGRQFFAQAGKLRRRAPTARRMRHVVAEKPHGKYATALRPGNASGHVQREHVEAHRVARLQFPAENGESIACGLDIRQ